MKYGNEVVNAIADRLAQFKGRLVFFDERLEVAREMVAKNLFEPSQLLETVNQVVEDDQSCFDCPSRCAEFCVDWISQTSDPAETLLAIGIDEKLAWYVRREAFQCLSVLPDAKQLSDEQWQEVSNVLKSRHITKRVRVASLWALVDHGISEALPTVRDLLEQELELESSKAIHHKTMESYVAASCDSWNHGVRYLTLAAAALGADELIPKVIEPLFADCHYKKRDAKRAFKQIVNRLGGIEGVADRLMQKDSIEFDLHDRWNQLAQHSSPAVVRWSLAHWPENGELYQATLVSQLSNSDWGIRHEACKLIKQAWEKEKQFAQQPLWDLFHDKSADQVSRSWAARTLLLLENSVDDLFPVESRESTKELWYVPWPFEADQAVRHAVAQEYGLHFISGTDIRYWLESRMFDHYDKEQATMDRESLVSALVADGIEVTHVKSAADLFRSGWGTYWSIRLGDELDSNEIYVSTLGRVASYTKVRRHKTEKSTGSSWTIGRKSEGFKAEAQKTEKQRFETIAKSAGFAIVGEDLLGQVVPNLNVKFFGDVGPQKLNDLIFYWVS